MNNPGMFLYALFLGLTIGGFVGFWIATAFENRKKIRGLTAKPTGNIYVDANLPKFSYVEDEKGVRVFPKNKDKRLNGKPKIAKNNLYVKAKGLHKMKNIDPKITDLVNDNFEELL